MNQGDESVHGSLVDSSGGMARGSSESTIAADRVVGAGGVRHVRR